MKMFFVFLLIAPFLIVQSIPLPSDSNSKHVQEFEKFVTKFGRNYQDEAEVLKRFTIFSKNLDLIEKYNIEDAEKQITYAVNDFADLTDEEYRQHFLKTPSTHPKKAATISTNNNELPSSIDWRNVNGSSHVTSVKYQGKCGSCWAFAVAQSIESAKSIAGGSLESLSSQELLDCTPGSDKCGGGEPEDAMQYVVDHGGINSAKSYPYLFFSTKCKSDKPLVAKISTYLLGSTEDHIASMVGSKGPVVVCANFATNKNRFYHGGIAEDPNCGTEPTHALIIVGYTPEYWILKNTYSVVWGEAGYMRVRRGVNWCGLTTENSILPIL